MESKAINILPHNLALFFLCIMPVINANAIKGVVVDANNKEPLHSIIIENVETGIKTITDENGIFEIAATINQSISFNALGYEASFLKIGNDNFVEVKMKKSIISLDSVEVSTLTRYQRDSVERYNTYRLELERKKDKANFYIAPGGIVITNPISSWMQYVAPRTKKRLRFQKKFSQWETEQYTATRYNTELVQELTALSSDSAILFMSQFPMDDEYARAATDNEIKMWIVYNYKAWLKEEK